MGAEQGYIGELNNNRQANAGFIIQIPDLSDRQHLGNSVKYDSNRPMIGIQFDQR